MKNVLKFLINVVISMIMLAIYVRVGWIHFPDPSVANFLLAVVAISLCNLVFALLIVVIGLLAAATGSLSSFVGTVIGIIVLVPFYGWFALLAVSSLTGLFSINVPLFWQGLVMSMTYGLIRFPYK